MKWTDKGVCLPEGFLSSGVACGIKREGLDLGILYCEAPCHVAAVFTTNRVKAAPVIVSTRRLERNGTFKAVVVNSGNANCCTGMKGINDAEEMCKETARSLGIDEKEVLVCSTGVIGEPLPMDRVRRGIARAAEQLKRDDSDFCEAILTTDTRIKRIGAEVEDTFRIGGCAKGAGMIYPNMATMLAFITTDVEVPQALLQEMLERAVDRSFNRISVDGDRSTNDTVMLFSKKGKRLPEGLYERFEEVLTRVCESLALMIVGDGEGATKVAKITVVNARTEKEAEDAARRVANSLLFKTALFGCDPNWGRIMGAIGASCAEFNPEQVDIYYGDVKVVSCGMGCGKDSERAAEKLLKETDRIEITIDLKAGRERYHVWTCDLSYEYVRINAEYRS